MCLHDGLCVLIRHAVEKIFHSISINILQHISGRDCVHSVSAITDPMSLLPPVAEQNHVHLSTAGRARQVLKLSCCDSAAYSLLLLNNNFRVLALSCCHSAGD